MLNNLNMKKYIFTQLTLILVSLFSFSQDCKYKTNEIDKFEKVEKVLTEQVKVVYPTWSGTFVFFSLGRVSEEYYLNMGFISNKKCCFNSKNNELLLMSNKDSIYRLKRINDEIICNGNDICSVLYDISKETLLKLKNDTIKSMRIYTSDSYIDVDMINGNTNKERAKNYFKNTIDCIIKKTE